MSDYLIHYGVKGQKWGKQRWTNPDGSLNEAGKRRYYGDGIPDQGGRPNNGKFTTNGNNSGNARSGFSNKWLKEAHDYNNRRELDSYRRRVDAKRPPISGSTHYHYNVKEGRFDTAGDAIRRERIKSQNRERDTRAPGSDSLERQNANAHERRLIKEHRDDRIRTNNALHMLYSKEQEDGRKRTLQLKPAYKDNEDGKKLTEKYERQRYLANRMGMPEKWTQTPMENNFEGTYRREHEQRKRLDNEWKNELTARRKEREEQGKNFVENFFKKLFGGKK